MTPPEQSYRLVPLSQGKTALVSPDDYDRVCSFKWSAHKQGNKFYVERTVWSGQISKSVFLHRFILEAPAGLMVDHINGNPLDNRRENLRLCTNTENQWNQARARRNTSGFKGVHWNRAKRKWKASIRANGKKRHLGSFSTPEEAHRAYCEAAKLLHGEFANDGNPLEGE